MKGKLLIADRRKKPAQSVTINFTCAVDLREGEVCSVHIDIHHATLRFKIDSISNNKVHCYLSYKKEDVEKRREAIHTLTLLHCRNNVMDNVVPVHVQ